MLAEGVVGPARPRRRAPPPRSRRRHACAARRGARLAAITSGGAIPDNNNYTVVQWPEETPGRHGRRGLRDRQLGRRHLPARQHVVADPPRRGRRACSSRTRSGQPPTIPFWFGEAPARTRELSDEVSDAARRDRRAARDGDGRRRDRGVARGRDRACRCAPRSRWSRTSRAGARRSARCRASDLLIAERFFDEGGGMQLVLHAPLGGRINRAWGLALRKKFCRVVRLRAAGRRDRRRHRDLARPAAQLPARHRVRLRAVAPDAEDVLIQALLDRADVRDPLALERHALARPCCAARRQAVPPHLIKMRAADTLSVVFPQAQACAENIAGAARDPRSPARVRDDPRLPRRGDGLRGPARRCSSGSSAARSRCSRATPSSRARCRTSCSTRTRTRSSTTRRSRSAARARCSCAAACRAEPRRRRVGGARSDGDRRSPATRSRRSCATPTSCTTRCSRCGSCPSARGAALGARARATGSTALRRERPRRAGCAGTLRGDGRARGVGRDRAARRGARGARRGVACDAGDRDAGVVDDPRARGRDRQDRRRAPRSPRPGHRARRSPASSACRSPTCSARCSRSRATARSCAARSREPAPPVARRDDRARRSPPPTTAAARTTLEWCNRRVLARIHRLTLAQAAQGDRAGQRGGADAVPAALAARRARHAADRRRRARAA